MKIIDALRLNKAIKETLQCKITKDVTNSTLLITQILKKLKQSKENRKKFKLQRELGIFNATLYLETNEKVKSHYSVQVFGEFSERRPW